MELVILVLILLCVAIPGFSLVLIAGVIACAYLLAWFALIVASLFALACLNAGVWWPAIAVSLIWAWALKGA